MRVVVHRHKGCETVRYEMWYIEYHLDIIMDFCFYQTSLKCTSLFMDIVSICGNLGIILIPGPRETAVTVSNHNESQTWLRFGLVNCHITFTIRPCSLISCHHIQIITITVFSLYHRHSHVVFLLTHDKELHLGLLFNLCYILLWNNRPWKVNFQTWLHKGIYWFVKEVPSGA